MSSDLKSIALAFSNGKFSEGYDYLAPDASWEIVGEKLLHGKQVIIDYCKNTAAYFDTVETVFTPGHIMQDGNLVVVNGTAVFTNKEQKITMVSSCDMYAFEEGLLKRMTSYCIVTNK